MRVQITYTTPSAPNAPTGLIAAQSSTAIKVSWNDNSTNEDGFSVERSTTSQSGFSEIATTTANGSTYFDTGAANDQLYYYRSRAFNAVGYSGYSNTDFAVFATAAPNAPSSLTATKIGTSTVSLGWTDNSTNEEGFDVQESSSTDAGPWGKIQGLNPNATSTLFGKGPGTYYYRIRAFNSVGESFSNTSTVTLP
jgi:titin